MYIQNSFQNNNAKLYIVPTPIGNLKDITYRAVEILSTADVIYCEDTRNTAKLLKHYQINKPLKAFHEHNKDQQIDKLLADLGNDLTIALVSDAGMPGISDPGFWAIKSVRKNNYDVVVLPGASAFIVGLVQSNYTLNEFSFYGFLPKKTGLINQKIKEVIDSQQTSAFYVSPHEINKILEMIFTINDQLNVAIIREISKIYEQVIQGTISEVFSYCQDNKLKGEIVLIIEAYEQEIEIEISIVEEIKAHISNNVSHKEAIKLVAKRRKLLKNDVYQEWIGDKND